jgi:phenylpyruvate tautomerase PptA (4-oxalocrotonate tautomerase family)
MTWKAQLATAITDAHVDATGAARSFVQVYLNQLPPGNAHSVVEFTDAPLLC